VSRGPITAEHVRRVLLAFVAGERASAERLGGALYPSPAESILYEGAGDPGYCADLAGLANDINAIGATWAQEPRDVDPAEHAAYLLLLRLPARQGLRRKVASAIADPSFVRGFLPFAAVAAEELLRERRATRRGGRRA
jgi:hypothetical protein